MPTLAEMMKRSELSDPKAAAVQEIARLGWLGSVDRQAMAQVALGKVRPDAVKQAAIESAIHEFQAFWKPTLDDIAQRTYGREAKADGVIGRATLKSIEDRICGVPDRMFADDGTPISMEGRWPGECAHDLGVFVDFSRFNSDAGFDRTKALEAFWWSCQQFMAVADCTMRIEGDKNKARFREEFAQLRGGVLGLHYLANNTCQVKTGQFDIQRWPSFEYFRQVVCHELGHGMGMSHNNGGLMNPSIIFPREVLGLTALDKRDLLNLGYAPAKPRPEEPTTTQEPDDPTDPPGGRGFSGRIVLKDGRIIRFDEIAEAHTHIFNRG